LPSAFDKDMKAIFTEVIGVGAKCTIALNR
jgi:hypothetical protein